MECRSLALGSLFLFFLSLLEKKNDGNAIPWFRLSSSDGWKCPLLKRTPDQAGTSRGGDNRNRGLMAPGSDAPPPPSHFSLSFLNGSFVFSIPLVKNQGLCSTYIAKKTHKVP